MCFFLIFLRSYSIESLKQTALLANTRLNPGENFDIINVQQFSSENKKITQIASYIIQNNTSKNEYYF